MTHETDRIEKKTVLHVSRNRVWRALTDTKEFGSWFGMKFDGPFVHGAVLRGTIVPTTVDPKVAKGQAEYEGMEFELRVDRIEPERLFSFRWHPYAVDRKVDYSTEPTTLVVFELSEVPNGILLTVTESGFDGIPLGRRKDAFRANEQGWGIQMKLIEKYLGQTA